jgi:hypothetical protein
MTKCANCGDCGWVCERHTNVPWEGLRACQCQAPGAPCPICNTTNDGKGPRMPAGLNAELDKKAGGTDKVPQST